MNIVIRSKYMSNIQDEFIKESKELSMKVYDDVRKPIMKPTVQVLGLIPRAINVALAPLDAWIRKREYNIQRTKQLLKEKMKDIPTKNIVSPEPYIAVPALQAISYCMNNDELRNMYANLLSKSMNKIVKNNVHPSFVEIIKQLSPDEAKILKYIYQKGSSIPTISLRYENDNGVGITFVSDFSDIGELCDCEYPFPITAYFDNLARHSLIKFSEPMSSLADKTLYKTLKTHKKIRPLLKLSKYLKLQYSKVRILEGYIETTEFGKQFFLICGG
jgi:hypothetical protein